MFLCCTRIDCAKIRKYSIHEKGGGGVQVPPIVGRFRFIVIPWVRVPEETLTSNLIPWMIRICLRNVDLPLSPAPSSSSFTCRRNVCRSFSSIRSISWLLYRCSISSGLNLKRRQHDHVKELAILPLALPLSRSRSLSFTLALPLPPTFSVVFVATFLPSLDAFLLCCRHNDNKSHHMYKCNNSRTRTHVQKSLSLPHERTNLRSKITDSEPHFSDEA